MKKGISIMIFSSTILSLMMIMSCFGSCGESKGKTNNDEYAKSEDEIVQKESMVNIPISGVQRLIDEATRYNIMYGDEQKASLSLTNPMPNVAQFVDTVNKMYVFEYVWLEDIQSIDKLNHKNGMKNVLKEMSSNYVSFNFMKLLASEGYGIRFNVEGSKTKKRVTNEVNSEEVGNLVDNSN